MLLSLTVKNFAIIDNISIDFSEGMTVLTGETGAGKSLIVDAIGLLFGDRASNNLVRYGESKALIEGVFSEVSQKVKEILTENDIDEEEHLIIRRDIYQNGKSLAKVNGTNVNLNILEDLSLELGDIHTQFDAVKLVNPRNYFSFIDNDEINEMLGLYRTNLKEYKKYNNLYLEKKNQESLNNQKLEFLKYQINELEKAKLDENEEVTLQNELKVMNNYEKISSNYLDFIKEFDDNNICENIYEAMSFLKKNCEFTSDSDLKEKFERLQDIYYNLVDIHDDIQEISRNLDFNPLELDRKNERLSIYSILKRKYKMNTKELIEHLSLSKKEIEEIENYDFYLDELIKEKDKYYQKTLDLGKQISNLRKQNANKLESDLIKIFPDLSLKNTTFSIKFNEVNEKEANGIFKANGIDLIDFMISFNKGEPIQQLNKIASGGELSRFMLAIKALSCNKNMKKTFLFDEIDSGVSGEIDGSNANKIKQISNNNQVICVTHLPQVASIADNQVNITKEIIDNNRTVTKVSILNYNERIENIALMISKGDITNASIALAKEFLEKK